ncbi:hypothetical protein M0802_000211 [Mischocyttarus mexicanus]|nr:hypothetical protein M0802_000211 [Mischocyttarus mexicanus]
MHFAIPDTEELVDTSNNIYIAYNVHINGLLHCTLRYRQFHNLHEELVKKFGPLLPAFPPKKFFPLTATQQEERRQGLEKYLQIIGHTPVIYSSQLFNGFLLNAQQELVHGPLEDEELEMLVEWDTIKKFKFSSKLNSGQVLRSIYDNIRLPEKFHPYFSLFIVEQLVGKNTGFHNILRKLANFESPVITYKRMLNSGIPVLLAIRRNYWDTECDFELLKDPYIGSAQDLQYYGYLRFAPCLCDYPEPKSKVIVGIGKNELNLNILNSPNNTELACKITRIRCWRITTLTNISNGIGWTDKSDHFDFELSFEYLFPHNKLQWITISSNQAILMSVCLQSMINELVLKSTNDDKQEPENKDSWVHINKDEQSRIVMENELIANIDEVKQVNEIKNKNIACFKNGVQSNVQKLIDVLMSSFPLWTTKNKNNDNKTIVCRESINEYSDIVANNPFYMIKDDVL